MLFIKPEPKPKGATLDTLVETIQPYFDKGWANHCPEILHALRDTTINFAFLNDFVDRQTRVNHWPALLGTQSFRCFENNDFVVRLNLWFPKEASPVEDEIKDYFSIGLMHNHSFPLFTTGLFGPGYATRMYRTDDIAYTRKEGETMDLDFQEELALGLGTALYIERDYDYHVQLWPEAFSISLNVIPQRTEDYSDCQYILNDDFSIREVVLKEDVSNVRERGEEA